MDEENVNQSLYDKMAAEQEKYRDWLLTQSPKDILDHAHEYAIREDILIEMDILTLPEKQAAALLESSTPLADICKDFRSMETEHMDNLRECIENRAERMLESKRESTRIIPVYQETDSYAREHNEYELWEISQVTNIACRGAIEKAIDIAVSTAVQDGPDGVRLTINPKEILAEFGPERLSFILAHTLQAKSFDPRYSPGNLAWAKTVPVADTGTQRHRYTLTSPPALLNIFVDMARTEIVRSEIAQSAEKQEQRKPSIKEQLAAKPVPSPKDKEAR